MLKKINWGNIVFELFSVFVGLLAALYVDSLIAESEEKNREKEYLTEIKNDLDSDITELEEALSGMQNNFESIQKLNKAILIGEISADSLVDYFGRLIFIKEFRPNFTAFDIVKSKGELNIIKNQKLIYELTELYEFSKDVERSTQEVKDYYQHRLEPFMLEHFDLKDYVWNDTVTIQSNQMIQDPFFQNLVLMSVQKYGTQLHFHKTYLKIIQEIKSALE
ncbi:MAG: hypothetical protein KDC84_10115 [Crocinitomicaceae bacterium]|nr:hypothetical protein [Crocinitomicaceae bacterium]